MELGSLPPPRASSTTPRMQSTALVKARAEGPSATSTWANAKREMSGTGSCASCARRSQRAVLYFFEQRTQKEIADELTTSQITSVS